MTFCFGLTIAILLRSSGVPEFTIRKIMSGLDSNRQGTVKVAVKPPRDSDDWWREWSTHLPLDKTINDPIWFSYEIGDSIIRAILVYEKIEPEKESSDKTNISFDVATEVVGRRMARTEKEERNLMPETSPDVIEHKKNNLIAALRSTNITERLEIDKALVYKIPTPFGGGYDQAVIIPYNYDEDYYNQGRLPPTKCLIKLERVWGAVTWTDEKGREISPRELEEGVTRRIEKIALSLLKYAGFTPEDRDIANVILRIIDAIEKQNWIFTGIDDVNHLLNINTYDNSFPVRNISIGLPNPWKLDEKWMTQWSDYPKEIREAVLNAFVNIFGIKVVAAFVTTRVKSTIKYDLEKATPGYYIPFIADWNLLPKSLKDAVIDGLQETTRKNWKFIVDSQRSNDIN